MNKLKKKHIVRLDCTMNKKTPKKTYASKKEQWLSEKKWESTEKRRYSSAHGRKLDKKKEEEERLQYVANQEERQRLWDLQKVANSAEWMELQNQINIITTKILNYEQYKQYKQYKR